jgi:hypothetical protein
MKFLCVPCNEPMKMSETRGPDRGSLALVYSCPACGYEIAMLTNPHETQLVSSLGVTIGADGERVEGESRCPFTGVARSMTQGVSTGAGEFPWTSEARERLEAIPAFIRPMAKSGIERFAREQGYAEVDARVLEEARSHFGM